MIAWERDFLAEHENARGIIVLEPRETQTSDGSTSEITCHDENIILALYIILIPASSRASFRVPLTSM